MSEPSLNGIRLDGLPNVPKVRRKKPAPYRRSGVVVTPNDRRAWRTLPARDLRVNDIVPDLGLISRVGTDPATGCTTVDGGDHHTRIFESGETVWAFAAVTSP